LRGETLACSGGGREKAAGKFALYTAGGAPHRRPSIFHTMGNLKKKRRLKMSKHKRRKRLKSNRHKKRTWQK
jgi:hypothetical protein